MVLWISVGRFLFALYICFTFDEVVWGAGICPRWHVKHKAVYKQNCHKTDVETQSPAHTYSSILLQLSWLLTKRAYLGILGGKQRETHRNKLLTDIPRLEITAGTLLLKKSLQNLNKLSCVVGLNIFLLHSQMMAIVSFSFILVVVCCNCFIFFFLHC